NFACYIGHSNLRRWVMGADASERTATPDEIDQMRAMVTEAMAAGAAGVSSSAAPTHLDLDDRPVPSRVAGREEMLALAEAGGQAGGASNAYMSPTRIGGHS